MEKENGNLDVKTAFRVKSSSFAVWLAIVVLVWAFFMTGVSATNKFIVGQYYVIGSSMEPTLKGGTEQNPKAGDHLYINKLKTPSFYDVIIICVKETKTDIETGESVTESKNIIKRVVGVPGDTVVIENGRVYRNGAEIDGDFDRYGYTYPQNTDHSVTRLEITLKSGEYFYLGDNRNVSNDARHYGACKKSDVVGVVFKWSIKHKKFIFEF